MCKFEKFLVKNLIVLKEIEEVMMCCVNWYMEVMKIKEKKEF